MDKLNYPPELSKPNSYWGHSSKGYASPEEFGTVEAPEEYFLCF
jgi:hypothetical protein